MLDEQSTSCARWRRRKEARPGEILEAALACFAERGFAATRLDDVARRAGVTKGTLYLYFPNKEELFKAVVRQAIVSNIIRGEALIAESTDSAPALLERLLLHWAEVTTTPASVIPKLVLAEAGNFPDLARFYFDEVARRGMALVRGVLCTGIEQGQFRPMDVDNALLCVIGPMIFGMLWRHAFERHAGEALDPKALARAHLDLLLRGLVPVEQRASADDDRSNPKRGAGR